eukprot:1658893-Rhodomonas_salina.2
MLRLVSAADAASYVAAATRRGVEYATRKPLPTKHEYNSWCSGSIGGRDLFWTKSPGSCPLPIGTCCTPAPDLGVRGSQSLDPAERLESKRNRLPQAQS